MKDDSRLKEIICLTFNLHYGLYVWECQTVTNERYHLKKGYSIYQAYSSTGL